MSVIVTVVSTTTTVTIIIAMIICGIRGSTVITIVTSNRIFDWRYEKLEIDRQYYPSEKGSINIIYIKWKSIG